MEEMKKLYETLQTRLVYLETQEPTDITKGRIEEVIMTIVKVQSIISQHI